MNGVAIGKAHMIIAPNSPLRRLPAELNLKQRLYFDGIRYSIEMANVAYIRLKDILYNLSINHTNLDGAHYRHFVPAILDAWSIIDSVERLRGLIRQTPGFKQKSPGLVVFDQKTSSVEALRNSVQHLNHEIEELLKEGLPVWGVLSWVLVSDEQAKKAQCFTLVPGTMFDRKPDMIVNPLGRSLEIPIGLITLKASGHTVCISEVIERVEELTRKVEEQLAKQFVDLPPAASDMLAIVEMEFGEDQKDKSQDNKNADNST